MFKRQPVLDASNVHIIMIHEVDAKQRCRQGNESWSGPLTGTDHPKES